ncbi:hypothetical protein NQ314_018183 [Rhamnusium bicolor]|uniref:C2H2-type domain-containing protein n=1 Tax=Rhamnusium bicolor TaxID=1586634 RepID=A0AAV8WRK7_9CUCU|nr:hypothetical protein NQ314_018183 [Rhamnusium bicolor]
MADIKYKICRLCLQMMSENSVRPLENMANIVHSVLPTLDLNISCNPMICNKCVNLLQNIYKYKCAYLKTENDWYERETIYSNELDEVKKERVTNHKSCRFCLQIIEEDHCTKLSKLENGLVETCIPELDLNSFQNQIICKKCLEILHTQYDFIKMCLCVEETINNYRKAQSINENDQVDLRGVFESSLKTDRNLSGFQIKEEKLEGDYFKSAEISVNENVYDNFLINEEISIKEESEVRLEKVKQNITLECTECTYYTTDKYLLGRHLLIHKDSSEVEMHKCNKCSYESKFKSNLTKHMLVHKKPTELEMFKCHQCKYQAKRKKEVRVHMLVHTDSSEVTVYRCNECDFQTKHKSGLTKHFLTHKDHKELVMKELLHQCPHCPHMAKHKSALNQHMLLHKKPEEITYYKCSHCMFKSIYKSSLVTHSLVHKHRNEMNMYECDICSFPAKTKTDLKTHVMAHDREFKCSECFFETKFRNMFNIHLKMHEILKE